MTRPGGDEGSFVIPDNRHMLGIFHISPWLGFSGSEVTMPMQCQASANNTLKDRAREAALTSDSSKQGLPRGSKAGFRCFGVCLAFPLQHRKLGREIARQLSRKSAQIPTHQFKSKDQEVTPKSQGALLKEQRLSS